MHVPRGSCGMLLPAVVLVRLVLFLELTVVKV